MNTRKLAASLSVGALAAVGMVAGSASTASAVKFYDYVMNVSSISIGIDDSCTADPYHNLAPGATEGLGCSGRRIRVGKGWCVSIQDWPDLPNPQVTCNYNDTAAERYAEFSYFVGEHVNAYRHG